MVQVNGDLTTCCLDEGLVNKLGNIRRSSLDSLWNKGVINEWRVAQIENRFSESGPLCDSCNWKSAGAYPMEKALAWLKRYRASAKV